MNNYWNEIPTLYECIKHIDNDYIDRIPTIADESPDMDAVLQFMKNEIPPLIINPLGHMEEYQIPGTCEASDGVLDLYRDGDDYYLIKEVE